MAHLEDLESARAPQRDRSLGRRLAGYCRGYLGFIGLVLVLTVLAAGAEYARAYLLKLLIDDVAIPQASVVQSAQVQDWLPDWKYRNYVTMARQVNESRHVSIHQQQRLPQLLSLLC